MGAYLSWIPENADGKKLHLFTYMSVNA